MEGKLLLETGEVFTGIIFGSSKNISSEIVFNRMSSIASKTGVVPYFSINSSGVIPMFLECSNTRL